MNPVAADVSPLTLPVRKIRADSRRLLRFRGSRRGASWGILTLGLALLFGLTPALAAANGAARGWERAVVSLEITRNQADFLQPWSTHPQSAAKAGIVVGPREILTTAFALDNRTLVRVQHGGRGSWADAEVVWVDYPANLALLTSTNAAFWTGLKPVALARTISRDRAIQVLRWRAGNLEVRKAEFNRFSVSNPSITDAAHVVLEINSEIDGAGWAEPVVSGKQVIGVVFAQTGNLCQVLPAPFLRSLLEARREGTFKGLGYFDFTWQPSENSETLRALKLPPERDGVVVIDVPKRPATTPVLQPRDILLEVDGFDVDVRGDYLDPIYGHLMLENLSTRNKWAGQPVALKIWREGRELDVVYTLPKVEVARRLVPESAHGTPPEYLILGGLILQPLTRNYLESWGQDWERRAPFRLAYFRNEEPSPERPSVVVLSQVLPDVFNLGYQDLRSLVLERINGRKVSGLNDVAPALAQAADGFHTFEFLKGESLQRLVLDARQLDAATQRVLQRYGIDEAALIRSGL
jgi:S1-C subfamily serine protease